MNTNYTARPEIDLDVEIVRAKKGERITEGRAEEIAAAAMAQGRVGVGVGVGVRPSLTAPGRRSPEVKARVSAELRDRLRATAQLRGVRTSRLVREALHQYLAA